MMESITNPYPIISHDHPKNIPLLSPHFHNELLGRIMPDARGLRGGHDVGDGDARRAQVVVDPLGDLGWKSWETPMTQWIGWWFEP